MCSVGVFLKKEVVALGNNELFVWSVFCSLELYTDLLGVCIRVALFTGVFRQAQACCSSAPNLYNALELFLVIA